MYLVGEHAGRGRSDILDFALAKVHFWHQKTSKFLTKDITILLLSCTSLDSMKAAEAGQGQGGSDEG